MHGGPLKPSVHLFSFRDLVQRKRRNKGQREFVHQVGAARLQPPQPAVKSTHMSTIPFARIIIKFA